MVLKSVVVVGGLSVGRGIGVLVLGRVVRVVPFIQQCSQAGFVMHRKYLF